MDHWRFYKTEQGGDVVREVLDKLQRTQKAAILDVAKRYTRQELLADELETIETGLFALRVNVDGCALRLYFGKVGKGGAICLAVHVLNKKSQKAPKKDLDTARNRLKEWNSRAARLKRGADQKKRKKPT